MTPASTDANRRRYSLVAGVAALLGAATCSLSMVLAIVGVAGVAASAAASSTGMGGMTGIGMAPTTSTSGSPLGLIFAFLVSAGPVILVLSMVAMAAAIAIRRLLAIFPVLVGGLALYWGMYRQGDLSVMYLSIAAGMLMWLAALAWSIRPVKGVTRLESR